MEWFDQFFGERPQASFTVALGLLNGPNCYGARLRMPDGKEELFCILGGGPSWPQLSGKPAYDDAKTTWTVPVKLKPDWSYRFMLNSDRFRNFRSREGVPLEPVTVTFKTAKKPQQKPSED